jgi:hypothetical protein
MRYLDDIEVFTENIVISRNENFKDKQEFYDCVKNRCDLDQVVYKQICDGNLTVNDVEITYVRCTKTPEEFQDEFDGFDYMYTTGHNKGRGAIECYMIRPNWKRYTK